jgi:hypothetical protein
MGHIFLLQADTLPYPLWNAVEFIAETEDAKLSLLTKGVYGGFAANYKKEPFYEKIHKYVDNEKRTLFIYPIKISSAELAKFNDTLNAWETKEDYYKFFTNNCVDGIYRLLKNTLDSIQEAPAILTPQDLIRLLNESGKIEKPLLMSYGNKKDELNFTIQKDMQIPHKFTRFDAGIFFLEKPYINLRFRLLFHDISEYAGYYSNFITYEGLVLNSYLNSGEINLKELWFVRIRSEIPSRNFIYGWSWLFESGLEKSAKVTNGGVGKSYLFFNDFLLGYMFRSSMLGYESRDYYAGFQVYSRGFSAKRYRFGAYFDYLSLMAKRKDIRTDSGMWLSIDLSENLNLFAENSIKNYDKNNFSVMFRFYL